MKTKGLMLASALFMELLGLLLLFLPNELSQYMGGEAQHALLPLVFQLLGALYLGFAILNFMARGNLIGGIYSRPVAIGNFMHFAVGGISLLKMAFGPNPPAVLWGITAAYVLFAVLFGLVLFSGGLPGQPKPQQ